MGAILYQDDVDMGGMTMSPRFYSLTISTTFAFFVTKSRVGSGIANFYHPITHPILKQDLDKIAEMLSLAVI